MDSKGIQIVKFKNSGEFELTLEGIQLFQSIPGPLGVIAILGPPKTGKSSLCKKLVSGRGKCKGGTMGMWAWPETLKVIKRDDDGTEYKLDLLVIDCEAVVCRPDENKTRGLEVLALACLVSSQVVYFTDQPLHTQNIPDLDIFAELANIITIRKHVDSFKSLHEYMPVLTWVIYGPDLSAPESSAGTYFEKILSSHNTPESSKIKSSIKTFFRKRNCFNAVSQSTQQFHRLIEFIQQSTPPKTLFGINLTGPILCSMFQTYISRLQKKSPAVIQSAFNRAVATEARKNIEKLYVRYLEKMTDIESRLPCGEEELWTTHNQLSVELIENFDRNMAEFSECSEITQEKVGVQHRMSRFYEDLKEVNCKLSEEKARKVIKEKLDKVKNNQEFLEGLDENEEIIEKGLREFFEENLGPSAFKVFVEEVQGIIKFLCENIRSIVNMNEIAQDEFEQELEGLKKSREKARENEQKLQKMLEESVKEFEVKIVEKDSNINEMQLVYNQKVNAAENKIRTLTRELKSKEHELNHIQAEKEALLEIEKNMFRQKEQDYEDIIERMREKILGLEKENEEAQVVHQRSLSAKDQTILEMKHKEKRSESPTESIQDYSILSGIRQDLSEMFILLESEQINNSKFVSQMDKIANLQAELNKCKLKEIETRNKITEEYEEKISELRDELERVKNELSKPKLNVTEEKDKIFDENLWKDKAGVLENEVKLKAEQNKLMAELIEKRDEQIESLYKVIETHKKQFEGLEFDFEDKETQLHKAKIELIQLRDDNDVLLGLMGYSLEILQKKRNIQAISLSQIQNPANRGRVIKIFKKFGIPFEQ